MASKHPTFKADIFLYSTREDHFRNTIRLKSHKTRIRANNIHRFKRKPSWSRSRSNRSVFRRIIKIQYLPYKEEIRDSWQWIDYSCCVQSGETREGRAETIPGEFLFELENKYSSFSPNALIPLDVGWPSGEEVRENTDLLAPARTWRDSMKKF